MRHALLLAFAAALAAGSAAAFWQSCTTCDYGGGVLQTQCY